MKQANKKILVTTFGASWAILPEIIGYSNPDSFDFYKNHPRVFLIRKTAADNHLYPVDEIWVIHTNSDSALGAIEKFKKWQKLIDVSDPLIRYFSYGNVSELGTEDECRAMSNLILCTVLHASAMAGNEKLYISLTGGRKNMSADIQRASDVFGCSCLIHIADSIKPDSSLFRIMPEQLKEPLPADEVSQINPMIVFGEKPPHAILNVDKPILPGNFPLNDGKNDQQTNLLAEIDRRLYASGNLLLNNYQQRIRYSAQTSFYGLQLLSPRIISDLENKFIGCESGNWKCDHDWLQALPKADLHCHLGGILNPAEMVEVASVLTPEITTLENNNVHFNGWMKKTREAVKCKNIGFLKSQVHSGKVCLPEDCQIEDPLKTAGFLSAFTGEEKLLEHLIYDEKIDPEKFTGIGIIAYMQLGDLQGSSLLKHPGTLAKTCEILVRQCREQNIRYCELRCSPANYSTKCFPVKKVVETIFSILGNISDPLFQLIIIGSRHKSPEEMKVHTELAEELLGDEKYRPFFAGFDIAGNEFASSPAELKTQLNKLLHACVKMTIHAGENAPASNIWEAAYELNADRIGHGLTLQDDIPLMKRFIDRKTTVEMCPSSNNQIDGFKNFLKKQPSDRKIYPLKYFFDQGVRVTINTDNPGISRTNITNEFLLAAHMTEGGLSKWDILKIVRNGFKGAFLTGDRKKELLMKVENEIALLSNLVATK